MNRKILAVLMSVVMLVMSVQVYGHSENNGYGENYQTHSGVSLYEEIDYQKLQADLQDFCIEQEKNGCTVTELTITYIMPEAIEQWLAGKEQEQFFGVSLSELEKEAGENTSFYFDENGLQSFNPEAEYNWEKIAFNLGAGCGIILVGVTVTALTGGTTGCVLAVMVKAGVTGAGLSGATTLAIDTASGMSEGKEFSKALADAVPAAVEDASTGFLLGTVISGVGIKTGLIEACFAAGTKVAVPSGSKAIEEICQGDLVYAYNEEEDSVKIEKVAAVSKRTATDMVEVETTKGDTIFSTQSHPWYVGGLGWTNAGSLKIDQRLRTLNGDTSDVRGIQYESENTVVYNLTVENSHTYYVGENSPVLVHNICKTDTGKISKITSAAQKALKLVAKNLKRSKVGWIHKLGKYLSKKFSKGLTVSLKKICLDHKAVTAAAGAIAGTAVVAATNTAISEVKERISILLEDEDDFFD